MNGYRRIVCDNHYTTQWPGDLGEGIAYFHWFNNWTRHLKYPYRGVPSGRMMWMMMQFRYTMRNWPEVSHSAVLRKGKICRVIDTNTYKNRA